MKAAPGLDAFEDQEVGRARRELDIGRAHDRAAIQMRRDLDVVDFGHAGDLLGFEQPADAAQVHLEDRCAAGLEQPGEIVLGGEPLSSGDRDAGRARDFGHFLGRVGRHRFFEPQRIVRFKPFGQPDRAGRRHLAVGAEQQICLCAHRLAQCPRKSLAEIERFERQLPSVKCRIRSGRIELQRGEALGEVFRSPRRRQIGIVIDVALVTRPRVDVGVGPQPLVHLPAEQLVDRLVGGLADDVPAGHFQRAQHAHQAQVRMLGKAARIDPPPQRFDVVWIAPFGIARVNVLDHPGDKMRIERHAVGLADTADPARRRQLDEHEVAPAKMRRRVADHERADLRKLHAG